MPPSCQQAAPLLDTGTPSGAAIAPARLAARLTAMDHGLHENAKRAWARHTEAAR